jgi:hypothetical protein
MSLNYNYCDIYSSSPRKGEVNHKSSQNGLSVSTLGISFVSLFLFLVF